MKWEKGESKIRNRYMTSTLYDVDTNSFMPRYRLWVKYKEYCKRWNWHPVGVKDFGRIIHASQKAAREEIIKNPEGVKFFSFRVKLIFVKTPKKGWGDKYHFPFLKVEPLTKKKGIFRINHFMMEMKKEMMIMVTAYFKEHPERIFNYEHTNFARWRDIKEDIDLFNDF